MTTQDKLLQLFAMATPEEQERILKITEEITKEKADGLPNSERLEKWQKEQEILPQTQAN